jgi:hypothetical protein
MSVIHRVAVTAAAAALIMGAGLTMTASASARTGAAGTAGAAGLGAAGVNVRPGRAGGEWPRPRRGPAGSPPRHAGSAF